MAASTGGWYFNRMADSDRYIPGIHVLVPDAPGWTHNRGAEGRAVRYDRDIAMEGYINVLAFFFFFSSFFPSFSFLFFFLSWRLLR